MKNPSKLPRARLNDCVDVDYLLHSGTTFSVMSRNWLTKLMTEGGRVHETPVLPFEFGLVRSDVTVVSRSMANNDMALDTKAGHVMLRNCAGRILEFPANW